MEELDVIPAALLAIVQIQQEDDADFEDIMMAAAEMAVMEIMDLEDEEVGLDVIRSWVPITINIQEYHNMPDPVFKLHFRMSHAVFEALTTRLREHLIEKGRLKRERTQFGNALLMVVWIMATPDSFRSVALKFGVRPGTLYYFYAYIIEALRELAPHFIAWPNDEERNVIKEAFSRATGFPGVVGCIDGTHVYVTAPLINAASYRNRNRSYSLNVQAVVDNTLLVRDLHVGEVGSMHDARVFRRSELHRDLLLGGDRLNLDEHLVGDGAYILTDYMMIPFVNNGHLNALQRNFNKKLSQSRVRVENSFGRAKGKWRRLKFLHARNQAHVIDHITASFVLHNFIITQGEDVLEEEELGRQVGRNEILGRPNNDNNEVNEDEAADGQVNPQDDEALLELAKARGTEKRIFIMNNLENFQ